LPPTYNSIVRMQVVFPGILDFVVWFGRSAKNAFSTGEVGAFDATEVDPAEVMD